MEAGHFKTPMLSQDTVTTANYFETLDEFDLFFEDSDFHFESLDSEQKKEFKIGIKRSRSASRKKEAEFDNKQAKLDEKERRGRRGTSGLLLGLEEDLFVKVQAQNAAKLERDAITAKNAPMNNYERLSMLAAAIRSLFITSHLAKT